MFCVIHGSLQLDMFLLLANEGKHYVDGRGFCCLQTVLLAFVSALTL